jgi:hypothetical protein
MEKEAYASVLAAISNIDNITNDRIEALTKSHGMTNVAAFCAANAIAGEILRGVSIKLTSDSIPSLPVEDVLKKGIDAAKEAGADSANAALFAATICYLAGSNAQAGVPAGNRKLGALARMIAGADRCGVIAIPTPKTNNKISGFPAVQALYKAMAEGSLTRVDGRTVPMGIAAGPLFGHNALGEDIVFPEISMNGGKIATQAMMDAYAGAGMEPSGIICAIMGAAAVLEIVHPDASVSEEFGAFHKANSAYLAGKSAAETAGLPETLHWRGSGEEFDTAQLVGHLGIILKDIGGPTVVGMMTFGEMLASFQEGIAIGAGFSGGPISAPLGHLTADAIIALKTLIQNNGDVAKAANTIKGLKENEWIDPENAAVSLNTISRKAEQVRRGLVTEALIKGTESLRAKIMYRIANKAYVELKAGKDLFEVVRDLDFERQKVVETRAAAMLGAMTGNEIEIKVTKLAGGSRRTDSFTKNYCSFDTDADVELTVNGNKIVITGLAQKVAPDAVLNKKEDLLQVLPLAAIPVAELSLSGHTILNITIPAAVAVALNLMEPKEAATTAEKAAFCTAGIPGAKGKAIEVATMAKEIVADL